MPFSSGTSNLKPGGPVIRTLKLPPAEGETMGEKLPRILSKVVTFTSLLRSFTCRKFTTWDRWLYFPSEERSAEDFFARKIRRLRPGLNPRTRVPEASTLTSRPPNPLRFTNTNWYIAFPRKLLISTAKHFGQLTGKSSGSQIIFLNRKYGDNIYPFFCQISY